MGFKSRYVSKQPDANGHIDYTDAENQVWNTLYQRQIQLLPGRACDDYLEGLHILNITGDRIPQLCDMNKALKQASGWTVHPVAALISPKEFFNLLANQQFPAATFIRTLEELDYVTEPDIFHEFFGHCPMVANPVYADFLQAYGKLVLTLDESDWSLMQRLFWFTVEFGLLKTTDGIKAYGGGILSSIEEVVYSVDSEKPERKPFDILTVLRTPYRIDMLQPIYFIIDEFQQLYDIINCDIKELLQQARELGEFQPRFPVEKDNPNIHIFCC